VVSASSGRALADNRQHDLEVKNRQVMKSDTEPRTWMDSGAVAGSCEQGRILSNFVKGWKFLG
jgi:hypothetical protein